MENCEMKTVKLLQKRSLDLNVAKINPTTNCTFSPDSAFRKISAVTQQSTLLSIL